VEETFQVLPAILVSGLSFAVTQFVWSNYIEFGLVDIIRRRLPDVAAVFETLEAEVLWRYPRRTEAAASAAYTRRETFMAWLPFLVLFVFVVGWGVMRTQEKLAIDKRRGRTSGSRSRPRQESRPRSPGFEPEPKPKPAVYELKWFSRDGQPASSSPASSRRSCWGTAPVRSGEASCRRAAHGQCRCWRSFPCSASPTSRATAAPMRSSALPSTPHRRPLSFLGRPSRLAWGGAHRQRHGLERLVREACSGSRRTS